MIKVEESIFIQKPVEDVFNFIMAEGNYSRCHSDVTELIEIGPRNMVGSRFVEVRRFMGQEMHNTLVITEFVPNQKWAAKGIKGPLHCNVRITCERSNGGTKFTTCFEGEANGIFKTAEEIVADELAKSIEYDEAKLKEMLEKAKANCHN